MYTVVPEINTDFLKDISKYIGDSDKRKLLIKNDWSRLWSEDNWIETFKTYSNRDLAGVPTDVAFGIMFKNKVIKPDFGTEIAY